MNKKLLATLQSKLLFLAIIILLLLPGLGRAQLLLLEENFNYAPGSVITTTSTPDPNTGWLAHSGNGTANIDVTAGLNFSGYIGGGIGGAANLDATGQDINKPFAVQSSGTVYAAFIIQTQSTNSQGYFFSFGPASMSSTFYGRIWVNSTGTGVGVGGSSAPAFTTISSGVPTLLVLKYDFTTTTSSLFVLNSFLASEPLTASGTFTETAAAIGTVALRQYNASERIIIDGIRVATTWAEAVSPSAGNLVASPVFTPASGNYYSPQSVSLTCATSGATIHYTSNGNDPDETSAIFDPLNPIAVSTTTTIKAKAYLSGMTPSGISSALYRFPISVSNIAALRGGLTDGTVYKLTGEALVTYARPDLQRNQLYIQDATAAIVVDDQPVIITTNYVIGDGVTGLTGTLTLFNSLLEFVPLLDPGAATSTGNTITPIAKTLSNITSADQAKLVSIPAVSFTSPTGNYVVSTNYVISDASGAGSFRTLFAESDYLGTAIPVAPQDMIALVGQTGTAIQITPRFAADMTPSAPLWISGWPKAEDASQTGFNAKVNINVPGTAYFVVLPNSASTPTSLQVKNGQDATGTPIAANLTGTIVCTAGNTEYVYNVAGLSSSTSYKVFYVAEAFSVLQSMPVMVALTTTFGATLPVITSPTASLVTNNSAVLGGNITSDGGSALTERGTVWSLTSPVTIGNNKLSEGGLTTGIFTQSRSSLPVASQIYYAAYATNAIGTVLSTESSFITLANEPSNHATAFTAGSSTTTTIALNWTDATGAVLPTVYLIKGSNVSAAAISDPVDGIPEANAALVQNVNQGVGLYTFTGLTPGTPYFFKIYPYTNTGVSTNFKTDPIVPEATASTLAPAVETYVWQGADNALWTIASNWIPERTTPAVTDILEFNDGTTKTATAVPTQTIGRLVLLNNTGINLQSAGASTLTIAGGTGTDLDVPAGCSLNLNAINVITINLSAGATGNIGGTMTFSSTASTAHRLTAADANAITFNSGAVFTAGANFFGNAFGTTNLNSVVFSSGSTYIHQVGSNPFGASQPASVVIFQTGSLYKVTGGVTPGFSGRTYADIEIDAPSFSITPSGTSAVSIDNLTITNGILNFNVSGAPGHAIKGNIVVSSGGALNFNPTSAGTVNLVGTGIQNISGGGKITCNTFSNLVINNSAGVNLNDTTTINGILTLTNGLLTLGSKNLTLGATATIGGTPSATNMIVVTGTGELRKTFTTIGSFTFPVGDNTATAEYSPVTLTFTTGTFASAYAGVKLSNSAYAGTSISYLNRNWIISSSGISAFACDALFNYVIADVIGTEADLFCKQVLPLPVTNYNVANVALHQLSATGISSFGTFTAESVSADKTLNLKAYFQGFWNGTGLNQAQDVDIDFNIWNKWTGTTVDTLSVYLADANAPFGYVFEAHAVNLLADGSMSVSVPASLSGSYYVAIVHRSSVETWSAAPISFIGSTIVYDFTTAANQAFASNQVDLLGDGSVWGFWGGEVYGAGGTLPADGYIDINDVNAIYNQNVNGVSGYMLEDITGDGFVDINDFNMVYNNNVNGVGLNTPVFPMKRPRRN